MSVRLANQNDMSIKDLMHRKDSPCLSDDDDLFKYSKSFCEKPKENNSMAGGRPSLKLNLSKLQNNVNNNNCKQQIDSNNQLNAQKGNRKEFNHIRVKSNIKGVRTHNNTTNINKESTKKLNEGNQKSKKKSLFSSCFPICTKK